MGKRLNENLALEALENVLAKKKTLKQCWQHQELQKFVCWFLDSTTVVLTDPFPCHKLRKGMSYPDEVA